MLSPKGDRPMIETLALQDLIKSNRNKELAVYQNNTLDNDVQIFAISCVEKQIEIVF